MSVDAPTPVAVDANRVMHRLRRDPRAWLFAIVFVVVAVVAIFAPLLAPEPKGWVALGLSMSAPSSHHLLGVTRGGQDLLSELIYATPTSILGMLLAVVVALGIGTPAGLVAGFTKGSWVDILSDWVANLLLAIPAIVVLLVFRGMLGPSLWISMGVLGVVMSAVVFRVVQATANAVRNELYIDAARVNGLSVPRIIASHVLRVVRGPLIIQAAYLAGLAIAIQAGLEFLGIGSPGTQTWGSLLNDGFQEIYDAPLQMLWPALAVGLTSAASVLAGNALTDALGRPEVRRLSRKRIAEQAARDHTPPAPASGTAVVSVRRLRVAYQVGEGWSEIVRGLDLDVSRGRVVGLVGESGSGKTHVVLAILGLIPSGGHVIGGAIHLDGRDLTAFGRSERRAALGRRIGYIPQEPLVNLDPSFRVGYQLTEPLRAVIGLSRQQARQRATALLERVGISDPERVLRAYPHEISGGMAQRVLIAGAVACEPDVLVADEPTTALDVTVQAEVLDVLRDLQQERGMGILLVTHNLGVVSDLCDDVAVMREGEIVEHGDVRTVLRAPRHEYTRALLAASVEGKAPLVDGAAGRPTNDGEEPVRA